MTEAPGVELVRAQPLLPLAADDARGAMTAYQELCKAILTRDDVQRVGDREFTKRSGFQKLAAAYGVSTEIVSLDITGVGVEEDPMVARAVVRATHPSGRHAEGDGACSSNEKRFRKGAEKIDHDLPATAVTRATNRAISNLVAFGTVSAEEAEMEAGPSGSTSGALPKWAKPVGDVGEVAAVLTDLFKHLAISNPSAATGKVGQTVFDACDDSIPVCVAQAIEQIAAVIRTPATEQPPDEEPVDAQAVEETDPASETSDINDDTQKEEPS